MENNLPPTAPSNSGPTQNAPSPAPAPAAAPSAPAASASGTPPAAPPSAPHSGDAKPPDPAPGKSDANAKPEDSKPAEGAPEKYDLKAPEGQTFNSDFLKTYEGAARDLGLTQEKAQAFIDKVAPAMKANDEARSVKLREEWATASRADKEFGGEKFTENLGVANKALSHFASPELVELLKASGLGNHPEVIRLFHNVGKSMSEDSFVGRGEKTGTGNTLLSFNDHAGKLYPGKN